MRNWTLSQIFRAAGHLWLGAVAASALTACEPAAEGPTLDADDIGGVVTGAGGPEAGVWVIAETADLPTRFARIVVTDDQGRYLIPDLPEASYDVWVRGYGLVDSDKLRASPGTALNLTAVPAPDARAAAEYYPAGYWTSLLHMPEGHEFPGSGDEGNGISPNIENQAQLLRLVKSGNCTACHQLGSLGIRKISAELGDFESSVDAWDRRVKSGQAGAGMSAGLDGMGRQAMLEMFADWTDRIAAGEVPPEPPRPEGVERNVVVTSWDWADPKAYLHDEVSTDRRNPTVNANGPIFGALEASADYVPVLDPMSHAASQVPLTVRDPSTRPASGPDMPEPSLYWGDEPIWTSKNNVHNPMLDDRGRLWLTSTVRPPDNPDFCREGSDHPSARLFPTARARRHLAMYDPETEELTHISTCFSTHHLMFAEDEDNTLWTSGGGQVVGWLNTRMFEETGDEESSQGWTALVLDTNGNGRRDETVEPDQPVDPTKDKRIRAGFYSVAPAPDGSVWATSLGYPGAVVRLDPGPNPPATALAELYELPLDPVGRAHRRVFAARRGHRPARGDVGGARQWAPGQLRPEQMHGTAQRSDGYRPALPRGLDLLPRATATDPGRNHPRKRRGELLHVGRSVQRPGARRERAHQHRQRIRRAVGPRRRRLDRSCGSPIRSASTPSGWTAASTTRTGAGRGGACGRR